MAKQEKEPVKVQLEDFDIDQFRDNAVGFFEKYKNIVYGTLIAATVLVGGLYAYFVMYKAPREKDANEKIFYAQQFFERDSFNLALNGRTLPGQEPQMGLLDIISEYGGTSAANLAHYYAGASLLNLGEFEQALKYLKAYSGGDKLTQAMAYGMMGDAKSELNDMESAMSYYNKAANYFDNDATSPLFLRKAGLLSEHLNKKEEALKYYQRIKKDYPKAATRMVIDKDIIRVGGAS